VGLLCLLAPGAERPTSHPAVRDGSGFIKKMNKLGQTSFSDRLLSAEKIPKTRPDPIGLIVSRG